MPECDNCGRHVSTDFARVFADDRGHVTGCPLCDGSPIGGVG